MSTEYVFVDDNLAAEKAVEHLSTFSRLGYDTEATGLDLLGGSRLLLMQLGTRDFCYVFDARKVNTQLLKPILESKSILKVLHNAKFDYQSTKIGTGILLDNVFDTMLAYRLLTSGLIETGDGKYVPAGFRDKSRKNFPYKSLNFLTQRYLGISLDKEVRDTFINHPYDKNFSAAQIKYAAEDIFYLHPLCDILSQKLAEEDLIETALLEFELVPAIADMELNGVFINSKRWLEIIGEAQKHADIFEQRIAEEFSRIPGLQEQNTLFGESLIEINSPAQILKAFKKLGFEDLEKTDEKALKEVDHPLADAILEYRGYQKLVSTYGKSFLARIHKKTGRLHTTFHQLGADTGRQSSENPNLQNIPNDKEDEEVSISFRDCFQAQPNDDEETVLLTADYSQCELRILAEVSQDQKFLEIFANDQDLHIITAQQVFHLTDAELDAFFRVKKKDKPGNNILELFSGEEIAAYRKVSDCRSKTKTINFGIVYGRSAFAIAAALKIPFSEAEEMLNAYFNTYFGVKSWLDNNHKEIMRGRNSSGIGYARTIIGRKKYFYIPTDCSEEDFKKSKGSVRRMGNNHVIQGVNADITKKALIELRRAYQNIPKAKCLFSVHDEIVSECPKRIADQVAVIKAEEMRKAFHYFIKNVPVGSGDKVSVSIATLWAK